VCLGCSRGGTERSKGSAEGGKLHLGLLVEKEKRETAAKASKAGWALEGLARLGEKNMGTGRRGNGKPRGKKKGITGSCSGPLSIKGRNREEKKEEGRKRHWEREKGLTRLDGCTSKSQKRKEGTR